MADAVVDQVDGRRIRIGERWLIDFASCNYLGFDLDPAIIEGIPTYLRRWGTHPSWSRMVASPALYERIEEELCGLLGAEAVLAMPTLTHVHQSILPVLAAGGTVLVDTRAHRTIHDACVVAKAHGTIVRRFRTHDLAHLERLLGTALPSPRVICTDGINSMTGNPPDLPALARLARGYGALLYVDDAHGFGVIGERGPGETSPYGRRGNALVRHVGESYDDIVLTAGCSKAYSSLLAFVACPGEVKELLKVAAPAYTYSGPSPVASLASVLLGLEVNAARGDELRAQLYRRTRTLLDHLDKLGVRTSNTSEFPIVELALANPDDLDAAGRYLFDRGIYVALAPYPVVPRDEVGFRVQLTAVHTTAEVADLCDALSELDQRFGLRRPIPEPRSQRPERATQRQGAVRHEPA
jgi:8-amino-7-oxononanoate synthase